MLVLKKENYALARTYNTELNKMWLSASYRILLPERSIDSYRMSRYLNAIKSLKPALGMAMGHLRII